MGTPIQIRRRRRWLALALTMSALSAAPAAAARPDAGTQGVLPPAPSPRQVEVVRADGFDWADAGIGAGTAAGIALLAGAAAAAVGQRRRLASGA